jgi:hypothetical protein
VLLRVLLSLRKFSFTVFGPHERERLDVGFIFLSKVCRYDFIGDVFEARAGVVSTIGGQEALSGYEVERMDSEKPSPASRFCTLLVSCHVGCWRESIPSDVERCLCGK